MSAHINNFRATPALDGAVVDADQAGADRLRAELAAIVESSDDAIIGKTLTGVVTSWNRGAEQIFGYSAAEMVGQRLDLLIPPDRQDEEPDILQRLRRGERITHFQTVRIAKDGRPVEVSLSISPIRDSSGRIIGISKIARDIGAQKRGEALLIRQTEELTRSNEELNRFASIASHDLMEPLRNVATFADFLQNKLGDGIDPEADEYLRYMTGGINRMQELLNDLLEYARVSARARPLAPVQCDALVTVVMESLRASIDEISSEILVEPLPVVWADALQLRQVFQNLIGNAIKFCQGQRPRVLVSASDLGSEWVFSVKDNGIGIAEKHFGRIFDIFQRLHTIEEYPGTGVGLSICKKIVERHDGRIWVESQVGVGSTFFFSIPKHHG